jgi:nucleoid-associated protein YgaU
MIESNTTIAVETKQLAQLYQLQALLTEIQINLQLLQQGGVGQVITVNGANLFQLAAQYYGDATLWTTIAQANGLNDPEIPAGESVTLVIPTQTTATGGILSS